MALDIGFRFAINHRTDIGGQRPGLPIRHSAIAPRSIFNVCRQSHLAGTVHAAPNNAGLHVERRGQHIYYDLFGQGGGVEIIAFIPPVSAMSGIGRP